MKNRYIFFFSIVNVFEVFKISKLFIRLMKLIFLLIILDTTEIHKKIGFHAQNVQETNKVFGIRYFKK